MKLRLFDSVTDSQLKRLQNKKICDVTEIVVASSVGYYKGWTGSTEEKWFSIVFVKGVLTVSVEEREMYLGKFPINLALSDTLEEMLSPPVTATKNMMVDMYNSSLYLEDLRKITFKDIMKLLKWKFLNRNVKVQEHFLSESLTNTKDMLDYLDE